MKKRFVLILMMLVSLSMILSSFAHAQTQEEQAGACTAWSQMNDELLANIARLQESAGRAATNEDLKLIENAVAKLKADYTTEENARLATCGQ